MLHEVSFHVRDLTLRFVVTCHFLDTKFCCSDSCILHPANIAMVFNQQDSGTADQERSKNDDNVPRRKIVLRSLVSKFLKNELL